MTVVHGDWGPFFAIAPRGLEPTDVIMGIQHSPHYWELWEPRNYLTVVSYVGDAKLWRVVREGGQLPHPWNADRYMSVLIKKRPLH